jgi:hypothetical protein
VSTCGSCGAPIRWAKTVAGRNIPLDTEPVPGGLLYLDGDIARFVDNDTTPLDIVRYDAHFASCPHADQHRRRTR